MIVLYKQSDGKIISIDEKSQKTTMPTASVDLVGRIIQYVGTTDANYTSGYFYKCIADTSTTPTTYRWEPCDIQSRNTYPMWTGTQIEHDAEVLADTLPYNALIGITDNNGENITWYSRNDTGVETLITTGSSGAMIDDYHTTSSTTWSSQKITNAISAGTPIMTGASAVSDGVAGFAPQPEIADSQRALFGDGKYHTVYTAASGSTIIVQTDETDLYGKTVTLTTGNTTHTATMSDSGEAIFTDISYYGTAVVEADDGNGNIARGSVNLTYFGNYVVGIGFNFSTIIWESTNIQLAGKPLTVYVGNREAATVTLTLVIPTTNTLRATMYVENLAKYKINTITSIGKARGSVTVDALRQTYTVNVDIGEIYAFKISKNDSNPATCVTDYDSAYGCDNLNFVPAHMDYTNDVFDYGSWTGQEFFFPRPCMIKYDGTVDYYLNPNDYSQRADGVTASDVSDMSYEGNVMVEFPTIYFKRWEDTDYSYCVISDKQLDADFHAWAHHDINGNVLPYIYLSAYDGAYDGTRMRSISGCGYTASLSSGNIMCQTTRSQEINFAQANNLTGYTGEGWYLRHKADWDMVNDLLILIGMSTDTQGTFGRGNDSRGNNGCIGSGTMDDKGLFWGSNNGTSGVKVFGIENWWGNIWKSIAGWINDRGTQKVKMTYGQEDGSTINGFGTSGTGYVAVPNSTPTGSTYGYIKLIFMSEYGMLPKSTDGSSSTFFCDGIWFNNNQLNSVCVGCDSRNGDKSGAFSVVIDFLVSDANQHYGSAISYKGIAV